MVPAVFAMSVRLMNLQSGYDFGVKNDDIGCLKIQKWIISGEIRRVFNFETHPT